MSTQSPSNRHLSLPYPDPFPTPYIFILSYQMLSPPHFHPTPNIISRSPQAMPVTRGVKYAVNYWIYMYDYQTPRTVRRCNRAQFAESYENPCLEPVRLSSRNVSKNWPKVTACVIW